MALTNFIHLNLQDFSDANQLEKYIYNLISLNIYVLGSNPMILALYLNNLNTKTYSVFVYPYINNKDIPLNYYFEQYLVSDYKYLELMIYKIQTL